jgi:colanic acid/amylovoran biosynthesis glycosyltransferase
MEASAKGLPVVSSYHSGIPEIVLDRITGFLCPERDVDELVSKLKDLIAMPELRQEMGLAARKHAEVHHNIDKLNDRLVEIYKGLVT